MPPHRTRVTLNRVRRELGQRSPGLETRKRRLRHPLKDRRCLFGHLRSKRVPHQPKHKPLKVRGIKHGLPDLYFFQQCGIFSRFFMCLRPSYTHKGFQELNNLETVEMRRWSIESSQSHQHIRAILASFFLLQKLYLIFQSLNTVIWLHKEKQRGRGDTKSVDPHKDTTAKIYGVLYRTKNTNSRKRRSPCRGSTDRLLS